MNINRTVLGIVIALVTAYSCILHARVGCMDTSLHCQRRGDTKAYHYVVCSCPCTTTLPARNQCITCEHYHDAKPIKLVPTTTTTSAKKNTVGLKKYTARSYCLHQIGPSLITPYRAQRAHLCQSPRNNK